MSWSGSELFTSITAATAAACPVIMTSGSIRSDEYATWLAEKQTGTSRFSASARFGSMTRQGIW